MKNKKAILMPEVLKILIAVICIAALIYLAVSLYGLTTKKTKIEQARATLDEMKSKINSLAEGKFISMLITSPNDWFIVSFAETAINKPKLCFGNCVCICEDYDVDGCNSGGLCQSNIDKPINFGDEKYIEIDKIFDLQMNKSSTGILLKRAT